jgi:hypothetical protein
MEWQCWSGSAVHKWPPTGHACVWGQGIPAMYCWLPAAATPHACIQQVLCRKFKAWAGAQREPMMGWSGHLMNGQASGCVLWAAGAGNGRHVSATHQQPLPTNRLPVASYVWSWGVWCGCLEAVQVLVLLCSACIYPDCRPFTCYSGLASVLVCLFVVPHGESGPLNRVSWCTWAPVENRSCPHSN